MAEDLLAIPETLDRRGELTMKDHDAAALFPLMDKDRFAELVQSIREQGLIHPIVLCEGKILDGRNRYRACRDAGVEPRYENYDGDPFAYVWNANGQRRDLTQAQRYLIWTDSIERSATWQEQQAARREEANRKRSDAAKSNNNAAKDRPENSRANSSGTTVSKPPERTSDAKASASHTNRGTVEQADELKRKRPDLATKVQAGEMTLTAARREMKRGETAEKVAALPDGKYRVIYADPPWQYNDERTGLGSADGAKIDRASTAAKDHYPTMSTADLLALDVRGLTDNDAVLFCWATFPLLPDQLEVVKAWGFKYKTAFVWDKQRGSFGNYHTAEAEILLVCTRGSCTPDADKRESQVQRWPRAEHSRKPDDARAMIDRLYPHGPRIELFRRGDAPDGWHVWGAEAEPTGAE